MKKKPKAKQPVAPQAQESSPAGRLVLIVGSVASVDAPIPPCFADWDRRLASVDFSVLRQFKPGQFDAVYCPFSLTEFSTGEAQNFLKQVLRLLKPHGYAHIRVRDISRVLQEVVQRKLDLHDEFCRLSQQPYSVHDMLYGARTAPALCGYSLKSLVDTVTQAGFPHVYGGPQSVDYEIVVYAFADIPIIEFAEMLGLPPERRAAMSGAPEQKTGLAALSIVEARARATELAEKGDVAAAVALYRAWIAATRSPIAFAAYFNMGCLLGEVDDLSGAIEAYRAALQLKPDFQPARANLGATYERAHKLEEAIAEWETLCRLQQNSTDDTAALVTACNNLGRVYELQKRYAEAEEKLTRSLHLNPDQPDVIHHLVHLRQRQCAWPIYKEIPGITRQQLIDCTSALSMLSATSDPAQQLKTSRRYIAETVTETYAPLAPQVPYTHERLRIGYLSSNFGRHAVSILTAELFELHNRTRFEIYGFSMSGSDGSVLRRRVEDAMDHFIAVENLSDAATAQAIREAEIDILIDLQGLTLGVRPAILAFRPAPIQITYLGFPGTTGSPWVDYVLADRYLIPEGMEAFYSEKPLFMPNCFQVNDRKREIGEKPSRAECGLPEEAFVFCAFNNNYKIIPELFAIWMRILERTPGSILWLLADNPWAQENLIKEAAACGIAAERLVFAKRIQPAQYLARYQVADLFLDTFPFNGGTTVSDALWAGLPVLTCSGSTFASRMGGSLLHNIGMNEFICDSFTEYENQAVSLHDSRDLLLTKRTQLRDDIGKAPLFDTPLFTLQLEQILNELAEAIFHG